MKTHGSLFSGIGGFDKGADMVGAENLFHCEINPFCRRILGHYWPNAVSYEDITTTDFRPWNGKIDILTGGFPCQDASRAKSTNGGLGLNGQRTGLYWHMLRAIEEIRPPFIIAENVPEIIRTNGGSDFAKILKSLYEIGYDAEWDCLYASSFGAPHGRERMYLVANMRSLGLEKGKRIFPIMETEVKKINRRIAGATISVGGAWNDKPPLPTLDDGVSHKLDGTRYWYDQTIQAAGNAVVPIIPFHIMTNIMRYLK